VSSQKKRYYVVVNGRKPGIYSKWSGAGEAADQVEGFPEAVYRGFYTYEDAINWLRGFPRETLEKCAPDLVAHLDDVSGSSPDLTTTVSELLMSETVVIFADGSVDANTGAGGYGVILKYKGHTKEISGGFRKTTNNRMEIMACIEGLRALTRTCKVVVFSDSQYVVNGISKGWARKWQAQGWMRNQKECAENRDLWAQLLELCDQHEVEFRWIRGHNIVKENERCDWLAMQATQRQDLPRDVGYEKSRVADSESGPARGENSQGELL